MREGIRIIPMYNSILTDRCLQLTNETKKPIFFRGVFFSSFSYTAISFLISAMARPGFRPLGQVRVQLRMVWQRYRLIELSRASFLSAFFSSRESINHR